MSQFLLALFIIYSEQSALLALLCSGSWMLRKKKLGTLKWRYGCPRFCPARGYHTTHLQIFQISSSTQIAHFKNFLPRLLISVYYLEHAHHTSVWHHRYTNPRVSISMMACLSFGLSWFIIHELRSAITTRYGSSTCMVILCFIVMFMSRLYIS